MSESKIKNIFIHGPISPAFIADSISRHSPKTDIGGHSVFMGQVRKDELDGESVQSIEYTAFEEMALIQMDGIRQEIFGKYPLCCMHVHHSLGKVNTGDICLFVFTSSRHRKPAIAACTELVERIKTELPIWGKEIFAGQRHQWKENR